MPKTIITKLTIKEHAQLLKRIELLAAALRIQQDRMKTEGIKPNTVIEVAGMDQTNRALEQLDYGVNDKIRRAVDTVVLKNVSA